jgi:hypothetical protein
MNKARGLAQSEQGRAALIRGASKASNVGYRAAGEALGGLHKLGFMGGKSYARAQDTLGRIHGGLQRAMGTTFKLNKQFSSFAN